MVKNDKTSLAGIDNCPKGSMLMTELIIMMLCTVKIRTHKINSFPLYRLKYTQKKQNMSSGSFRLIFSGTIREFNPGVLL